MMRFDEDFNKMQMKGEVCRGSFKLLYFLFFFSRKRVSGYLFSLSIKLVCVLLFDVFVYFML